jgi:hypothetical protein
MNDHFKNTAKAYASGLTAFLGSVFVTLGAQPINRQGIEYIPQIGWLSIALFVLASYGFTYGIPNQTPAVPVDPSVDSSAPPKQGAHVA